MPLRPADMPTRATLKEVAERAGVSQMTVSRVLNSPDMVRSATRERVQSAVAELGYRPNLIARSLAGGRTLFIGLTYQNPSNAYLGEALVGAMTKCRDAGHHLIVEKVNEDDADRPDEVARRLINSGVNGVIVLPPLSQNKGLVEALRRTDLRLVLVSPDDVASKTPRVVIDDSAAASEMTRFLIDHGHRRIGFIRGPADHIQAASRFPGYKDALAEAGIPFDPTLVGDGAFTFRSGMDAAENLLRQDNPPTAIFAANDDMAAGAITAAHLRGLSVPADLSIAGFDDTELARTVYPPLTTVRQPIAEMACQAVDVIAATAGSNQHEWVLDYHIVERETVVRPKHVEPTN